MHDPEVSLNLAALSATLACAFCKLPIVGDQLVVLKADLVKHLLLLCHLIHELLKLPLLLSDHGCLLFQLFRLLLDTVMLRFIFPQVLVLAPVAVNQKHHAAFLMRQKVLALD